MGQCKGEVRNNDLLHGLLGLTRAQNCDHVRPTNFQELFNLRHASARNVVERLFGVLKRRFKMFHERNEFPIRTQSLIIPALCALHNFILTFDSDDIPLVHELVERRGSQWVGQFGTGFEGGVTAIERDRALRRRDEIAKAMWESYDQYIHRSSQLSTFS